MDFNNRIFVGLTCTSVRRKKEHWRDQLKEINELRVKEITLFPTTLEPLERKELYKELDKSCVKKIKLVHMRGQDFSEKELEYLFSKYGTRCFNCHENRLDYIYKKFPKFKKYILLELDYNSKIENKIDPSKMGGFCIDLSHIEASKESEHVEYDYMLRHVKNTKFAANHLNGYCKKRNCDMHFVNNLKEFDYLLDLPKEIFSKVIGMELENTIKKQLEFKEYLVKMLNNKFAEK